LKKRLYLFLFLAIFLGLILVFVIFFRNPIRDYLAGPISYFFWYIQKLWRSADSDMVWGMFITLSFVIVILTFPAVSWISVASSKRRNPPSPGELSRELKTENKSTNGRIAFWYVEIRQSEKAQKVTKYSMLDLKKLLLDTVAFSEQLDSRYEAGKWLDSYPENLIPEVSSLFKRENSDKKTGFFNSFRKILNRMAKREPEKKETSHADEMEAIINYLEHRMNEDLK